VVRRENETQTGRGKKIFAPRELDLKDYSTDSCVFGLSEFHEGDVQVPVEEL